jgi:predicted aldo/keto reductase-like oxidoreductase
VTNLPKRRLGKTELKVTELGLGAMDTPQTEKGFETISTALDLGINFIDTARIYQNSEYLIGQVLQQRSKSTVYINSKTIYRDADGCQYDIDKSLKFLGVNKLSSYQIHDLKMKDWQEVMGINGALEGLKIARMRGLIDFIGVSSHELPIVKKVIECGEFDTIMVEYSAFYPESRDLLELARQYDIGVIIMRPLGGSGRTSSIRNQMKNTNFNLSITPQNLLKYVLSNSNVSTAIAGARFPSRIIENVQTASSKYVLEEAEKIQHENDAQLLFKYDRD